MITKVGSKAYEGLPYYPSRPRLSAMERSLLKWAVIEPDDKVLDAGLGQGLMVEYLRRNMECEVCGVSDDMELVRHTRGMVRSADLVFAADGDIPWRDEAFDTVLLRPRHGDRESLQKRLAEIKRVLKDGGQLALGVKSCPRAVRMATRWFLDEEAEDATRLTREEIQGMLRELDFEHFSWQRASLWEGVLICWKKRPVVDRFLAEAEA